MGIKVKLCADYVEIKQRNWHLFSVDTTNVYFKNLVGVDVDKHFIGATIIFRLRGDNNSPVYGFSKKRGDFIKNIVKQNIINIDKRNTEHLLGQIQQTMGNQNAPVSVTQELKNLKELLNDGTINQQEFNEQKRIILNQD